MKFLGLMIPVILIVALAVYTGIHKKDKGKKGNSSAVVSGLIMGTLVGGSSTVGTAQLAYNYGMSAWWFTLGGGIACLILTLFYVIPLRKSGSNTLVGIIGNEYGAKAGLAASILNSLGAFINIISQLIAASAVILVVQPNMDVMWTIFISAICMICYVIFGGTKGAGIVGILKLILLYIAMMTCGIIALQKTGGISSFIEMTEAIGKDSDINFFSIFSRGVGQDLGSGFSLILGVLTTQTYAQAVMNARSDKSAKVGGLISAFMIPPIGILGILVGLYMRSTTDVTTFAAKTALTQFAIDNLPPIIGGMVLGVLFISSIGAGAGLALGISTVVNNDIIKKFTKRFNKYDKSELLTKVLIVMILVLASLMSSGSLGDTILKFAFMSMALRGAAVFFPLCGALFYRGKFNRRSVLWAIVLSPIVVLAGNIAGLPFDPLFIGMFVSFLIMCIKPYRTEKDNTGCESETI